MKYIIILIILGIGSLNAQTLDDYLKIAKENSLEITAKNYAFEASTEKANQLVDWKDTKFNLGYFLSQPQTRVGAQTLQLGIQQQIPLFGINNAKQRSAILEAETKTYDVKSSKRKVELIVKQAYYSIYKKKAISKVLETNLEILKDYENLALSKIETNDASMTDILKLQIKQNEIENNISVLKNLIASDGRNFNRLLFLDSDSDISIPDSLPIFHLSDDNPEINHPKLDKYDKLKEFYDSKMDLIAIDRKPKLGIGLNYIFVSKRKDISPSYNGKDIFLPMVSLSVPLKAKRFDSKLKQIEIQKEMTDAQKNNEYNNYSIELEKAKTAITNSLQSIKSDEKNINKTQSAIKVSLGNYETGRLDFDAILDLQMMIQGFQIDIINEIKNIYLQNAVIDFLTKQ